MCLNTDKKLRKTLETIRSCLIQVANSNQASMFDWHKRNDLKCACAISSIFIGKILLMSGYDCNIIQGVYLDKYKPTKNKFKSIDINHCWIQINETIIDLTASQFGEVDILISDCHIRFYPVRIKNFKNFSLRHFSGWPKSQKPFKPIVKTLMAVYNEKTQLISQQS